METVGSLIDKLTIENIRIWHAEDIKRKWDATDEQIAYACRITNVANQKRNDLIQEIDEVLGQKNYKQGDSKMYGNDLSEKEKADLVKKFKKKYNG